MAGLATPAPDLSYLKSQRLGFLRGGVLFFDFFFFLSLLFFWGGGVGWRPSL